MDNLLQPMSPLVLDHQPSERAGDISPTLFVRNLTKRFANRTVLQMSNRFVSLCPGDRLAIIGPNGSGKTTLLHLILRLHRPTNGWVDILGESVCWPGQVGSFRQASQVGVVLEDDGLYPDLSGLDNLKLFGRAMGVERLDERVAECWRQVKLPEEAKKRRVSTYSRGMRQRVAIARAVLKRPKLLIMDDPTSALDVDGWGELTRLLRALADEGTTLVICSHNLSDFLDPVCDKFLLVCDGECVGPVDSVPGRLREQVEELLREIRASRSKA